MNESAQTSLSLIHRARGREEQAWERICHLYTPIVYRWARRARMQEADAVDIVQEVFEAVSKSLDRFQIGEKGASFRGWLYGITRNKVHDFHRRKYRQPEGEGGTEAHLRIAELPEEESIDSKGTTSPFSDPDNLAYRALALIKTDFQEQTWTAFWRVTVENQAAADVASDLGISVGAVYTAKSRVLRHLRNELDGLM